MYVYVHNLLPRQNSGGKIAWFVFTGKADPPPPRFAFGERVVFWTEQEVGSKLLPRGSKGKFLGPAMVFAQTSFPICHRVWHTEEETPNDRLRCTVLAGEVRPRCGLTASTGNRGPEERVETDREESLRPGGEKKGSIEPRPGQQSLPPR